MQFGASVVKMNRWRNQVAVVTGASAGIGAAIAEQLVCQGMKVVGLARRKELVEEIGVRINAENGKLYALKVDMTKENEILDAFQWIENNVGPISVLVNNAGIGRKTTIIDGDIKAWKEIFDTNIIGLAIATREAVKSMQLNKIDGHIVNINSVCGHLIPPLPYLNVYPASKYAVTAFTEKLRQELVAAGSKIRVSSLSPGFVNTDIFEVSSFLEDENVRNMLKDTPMLTTADIADATLYILASPAHVQVTELTIKPVGEAF